MRKRVFGSIFDGLISALREYAEAVLLALLIGALLRGFVLSAFMVQSDSMRPSLYSGDILIGYKLPFVLRGMGSNPDASTVSLIQRGDLIVIRCPGRKEEVCLKRVIAIPGELVEMRRQRLSINGVECTYVPAHGSRQPSDLHETCGKTSWLIGVDTEWEAESWGPEVVPPLAVFVLNDNRSYGSDSRQWGMVPQDLIVAQVKGLWISLDWGAAQDDFIFPKIRWERTFLWLD